MTAIQQIEAMLQGTDISFNGKNPWDIIVPKEKIESLCIRILNQGSLGLGEAYMDGWWNCGQLDVLFTKLLLAKLDEKVKGNFSFYLAVVKAKLFNQQTRVKSMQVAKEHYDLDTKLYESFLDLYNQYTCGYFKNTNDLTIAQQQKLELICKKLQLKPTDTVLDIGCGWGGFSKYAAEKYGCTVWGISISKEQIAYATEFTKGLPVKIKYMDYRDLPKQGKKFDKVLICGMIEHVGPKNYAEIMRIVRSCIKDDGLFLLHTIMGNTSVFKIDPWIDRYIFPNSVLPSNAQLTKSFEGQFVLEDVENFSAYYDKTLMAWHEKFVANWSELRKTAPYIYDERFYLMWEYYLLVCAASFRSRVNQLQQFVLSPNGVPSGYVRPNLFVKTEPVLVHDNF